MAATGQPDAVGGLGDPVAQPDWEGALGDEVTISALEHYSYCPRQCALICIEQVYRDNLYTVRGNIAHRRVDTGVETIEDGVRVVRSLPLWSGRLRLSGKADVVEMRPEGPYPVEFKYAGKGPSEASHAAVQLCAQALCLEEMLGRPVPRGALYTHATRTRREVALDAPLRERTLSIIEAVRALLGGEALPPPVNDARCRRCSLADECLPAVLGGRGRLRGLQGALYDPATMEEGAEEEA